MKSYKIKLLFLSSLLTFGLFSCSDDDNDTSDSNNDGIEYIQGSDLSKYSSGTEVMMQAFYWDVPEGGTWYDKINAKVSSWSSVGINKIWLPAPGKAASGGGSMGYDPYDYFDVGEFDQKGSTETRFGSKSELEALLKVIHDNKMTAIADIVINHNFGGDKEITPSHGEQYTKFNPKSGKFLRTYKDFVPFNGNSDEGETGFGENLDLSNTRVQNELWGSTTSVAQFYKSLGYDGWRFDYVKGFKPERVKQWNEATGNMFSVGEYFERGDINKLKAWVEDSNSPAFDFVNLDNMEKAFDSQRDLSYLTKNALFKIYPSKAVTFVSNHDIDDRGLKESEYIATRNKMLAYAFIMTHPGLPTVFYSDYEYKLDKNELNNLIKINKSLAKGDYKILFSNQYEYIMRREGDGTNPGLIIYINLTSNAKTHSVLSNWKSQKILDYSYHVKYTSEDQVPTTDATGLATLTCPGNSYTIWSVK